MPMKPRTPRRWLPALDWLVGYNRQDAALDLLAAVVVTVLAIPQSLAYAMLAGLPPQAGLYASILPLVAYALFGSSKTLSVGPVALLSLLMVAALGRVAAPGSPEFLAAGLALTAMVGVLLIGMGVLRLGWIVNYLSHPVISGFVTASAILISASQLSHLLGVGAGGNNLVQIAASLARHLPETSLPTLLIGLGMIVLLYAVRGPAKALLQRLGVSSGKAAMAANAGPVIAVVASIMIVLAWEQGRGSVRIIGAIPQALPPLTIPSLNPALWKELLPAALIIALVGFVQSISIARTLAAKRRERISANQELIGLGAANLTAAFSGGLAVSGSFSRSVVNFDAGARTPMANVFSAIILAFTALFLTPLFFYLPQATLAAIIIVAVLSLVDWRAIHRTWLYSRSDFAALCLTVAGVLLVGVEQGVLAGVALSIVLYLWKTSHPHIAMIGLVPGTEHFRNVQRHAVVASPSVLGMRIDESLYFANARYLGDAIYDEVLRQPAVEHVVLACGAVNQIDSSALESLEELMYRLADAGVKLHLSEVKGPVMDQLKRSEFLARLTGEVFLSQFQALATLDPTALAHAQSTLPQPVEHE
jgi:SulP family sulfate permease